ncbi:MAG: hypothetical protein QOE82_701 [Thermoanaerobaculia bacterium]|jgi:hypothetical protein|nr:hypothetical protein [Thermoanaerobaculia bacterium]
MRSRFLLLFALLLAPVLAAETIRFEPPDVTVHHSVDAIVNGVWPHSCLPKIGNVALSGSTITLHLDANVPPNVGCLQALQAYSRTFHLEVLPAGAYTVIAVADAGGVSRELGRATLAVRDTDTLSVAPYGVPTGGGLILVSNPSFLPDVTLTIGGVTVTPRANFSGIISADAPPHAAGPVDVVINSPLATVTAKAALIYYDPAAADPAVFEPILFPLSFQGPGALGSQWTTESFLHANGSLVFFRDAPPCNGCGTMLTVGTRQLINNGNPWGHVLYVLRGRVPVLEFASRIRDTSRQSQTAGTEVPVVHERDFRSDLYFMNIPADPRYRVALRLWSLGDYPQFLVANGINSEPRIPVSVSRIPGTDMWFGSADMTPLLTGNFNPTIITVVPSGGYPVVSSTFYPPIWGMLSITNNETQQVTIVSPK